MAEAPVCSESTCHSAVAFEIKAAEGSVEQSSRFSDGGGQGKGQGFKLDLIPESEPLKSQR